MVGLVGVIWMVMSRFLVAPGAMRLLPVVGHTTLSLSPTHAFHSSTGYITALSIKQHRALIYLLSIQSLVSNNRRGRLLAGALVCRVATVTSRLLVSVLLSVHKQVNAN